MSPLSLVAIIRLPVYSGESVRMLVEVRREFVSIEACPGNNGERTTMKPWDLVKILFFLFTA